MGPLTRKKIEDSIAKWEGNAKAQDAYDYHTGADTCPLCKVFRDFTLIRPCKNCPVYAETGLNFCVGTPYENALHALLKWQDAGTPENENKLRDAAHAAALKEIEFLKFLLAQGHEDA